MRRFLPLAVASAFLLAACGSSGSSAGSTSTTTKPGSAADRTIARAGLVQESDLPDWAKVRSEASEANDLIVLAQGVPECEAFRNGNLRETVNGRSPGFVRGGVGVNSSVVVYSTEEKAAAELELYRDPAIVGCLEAVYGKLLKPKGVTKVSISPVAAEGVTNGFGFLVTAEVARSGGTGTLTAGIQGVQAGRALSSINVTGTPEEIAQISSTVMPNIEQRLQSAQQ